MDSTNFAEVSMEILKEWHEKRQEHLKKVTNGFMQEPFTTCPIENELRYLHRYIRVGHYLIHETGESTLELHEYPTEKRLHLGYIGVTEKQKGTGTKVMTLLTSLADKYGYSMDLEISPKFGVGKRVLNRFYKKFGFERHAIYKDYRVRMAIGVEIQPSSQPRIRFI